MNEKIIFSASADLPQARQQPDLMGRVNSPMILLSMILKRACFANYALRITDYAS
jgi:hypothetical protein